MEIQYYGSNCIRITTKKSSVVIDDNLSDLGIKVAKDGDTVLSTSVNEDKPKVKAKLNIDQPGEYEVSDISVLGIPTKSYKDDEGTLNGTIFKLEGDDVKIAVIGNSNADLTDSQLETLGAVDVLIVPVGGNQNTLSGSDALRISNKVEPYILIPTHYADKSIKYKEPQMSLTEALKELAMEPSETVQKLKLKSSNFIEGEATILVVLET